MAYADYLSKDYSDLLDEIHGIAAGSGTDFEDIMVLNTRYELLKFPLKECTTFSLLSYATQNNHVYIGMNWDNLLWMKERALLMSVDENNGMKYFCMTEAGQLIRHGFNNYGLGITTNNLLSTGDKDELGVPTNFMRRRALTSHSLQEAIDSIQRAPRAISCNLMLCSSENNAVDIEVNPIRYIELNPCNGILTHANHFSVGIDIDRQGGPRFRDERLRQLLNKKNGAIDLNFIMEYLKDHYKKDPASHESVCKHAPAGNECTGMNPFYKITKNISGQHRDLGIYGIIFLLTAICSTVMANSSVPS